MKLHYFHGRGPLRELVLTRRERWVELHVKAVGDEAWAVVALSGTCAGQPEKHRCQGPYRSVAQAEAALRGIAGALLGDSFEPRPGEHVVWSVTAQRLARTIRTDSAGNGSSCHFDPDQYEPIG